MRITRVVLAILAVFASLVALPQGVAAGDPAPDWAARYRSFLSGPSTAAVVDAAHVATTAPDVAPLLAGAGRVRAVLPEGRPNTGASVSDGAARALLETTAAAFTPLAAGRGADPAVAAASPPSAAAFLASTALSDWSEQFVALLREPEAVPVLRAHLQASVDRGDLDGEGFDLWAATASALEAVPTISLTMGAGNVVAGLVGITIGVCTIATAGACPAAAVGTLTIIGGLGVLYDELQGGTVRQATCMIRAQIRVDDYSGGRYRGVLGATVIECPGQARTISSTVGLHQNGNRHTTSTVWCWDAFGCSNRHALSSSRGTDMTGCWVNIGETTIDAYDGTQLVGRDVSGTACPM